MGVVKVVPLIQTGDSGTHNCTTKRKWSSSHSMCDRALSTSFMYACVCVCVHVCVEIIYI